MNALIDRPVFDVSLVVGHRDYLGKTSDFSAGLVRQLAMAARGAKRAVPILQLSPPGRYHFTLRGIYGDRPRSFSKATSLATRQKRYAQVQRLITKRPVHPVRWSSYAVSKDGVFMLVGKAQGPWLKRLRQQIDQLTQVKPPFAPSSFCHIVLARPSRPLSDKERQRLTHWIKTSGHFQPFTMLLKHPTLIGTRNHFGTRYDPQIQKELT